MSTMASRVKLTAVPEADLIYNDDQYRRVR